MCFVTTLPSPVGLLTLASDGTALTGLWLEGQKVRLAEMQQHIHRKNR